MSWPIVTLGDIGEFRAGFGFPDKFQGKDSGDLPFAKVGDISTVARCGEKYISTARNYVDKSELPNLKAKPIPAGSIVFAKIGEAIRQNFRAVTTIEMLIDNNTMGLVPNLSKVDVNYLFHFMCTLDLYKYAGATTVPAIRKSILETIEIPLPPLAEQKRIAAILDKADAIRRKRQQAIELADDFLRSVFLDMFGDPVTNPKGWEIKTIEELVKKEKHSIKRGPFGGALKKEIFKESGYLVYEQFHALNDDFTFQRYFIDDDKFSELKAFEVFAGDIIISCSGVNLGRLAIVPNGSPKGIINQALLKVTLDNTKILNDFFVNVFSNPNFKNEFFGDDRGSGVPNFPPMSSFKEFKFICPPINLQLEYLKIFNKSKRLLQRLYAGDEGHNDLFFSLSKKAFSGNL